jgi:hypothetical protein
MERSYPLPLLDVFLLSSSLLPYKLFDLPRKTFFVNSPLVREKVSRG